MSYEDKKSQENPPVKEDSLGLNREERWQLIQYFNGSSELSVGDRVLVGGCG